MNPRPAAGGRPSRPVVLALVAIGVLLLAGLIMAPMSMFAASGLMFQGKGGCGPGAGSTAAQPPASASARDSIPADYLALFKSTGAKYGIPWVILAGIGKVESDDGQSALPGVHSGANAFGAAGPMQIGIGGAAGNNWGGAPVHPASEKVAGVATDGNGDGIASVYQPADAIAGAAKVLLAGGAPGDIPAAIFAYNHSQSYVQAVQDWARQYSAGGYTVSAAAAATGGSAAGCLVAAITSAGYANPLRGVSGLVPERVDMGVDFAGSGPVYALGSGVITNALGNTAGWPGGGWITYRLSAGPAAGLTVYVAEDVRPAVQVGQQVSAGTVIARMFAGGSGIETGWAMPDGSSAESQLPAAGGISGGGPFPTDVGLNFEALLRSLGVPAAPNAAQPGSGILPPGYPAAWTGQSR